jgi:hypothetical protein
MTDNLFESGSCFCGEIAAELHGPPFWVCYDHDDDCRHAIGSPLTVWVGVRPEQFRITRGQPKSFSKTERVVRRFCPTCGTSISYCDRALSDELYVTIGFFDYPEAFRAEANTYWGLRLPWVEFADGLPDVDGYSRVRDAT